MSFDFDATVKLLNQIVEGLSKLVQWIQKKVTAEKIKGAIEKSDETNSQLPLEELTGDSGTPSSREYNGMRRRKKSGRSDLAD